MISEVYPAHTNTNLWPMARAPYPNPRSPPAVPTRPQPQRFYGSVTLDTTRAVRDATAVVEEVAQHLSSLLGARVEITMEIHAELPEGAPEHTVRTVTENCRTLKFSNYGFEDQ